MGGDNLLPELIGKDTDSPMGKQIGDRRGAIFRERYLPTVRPFPRVEQLLQRVREQGHKLVVASSAQEDELALLLDIARAQGA